MNNETIQDRKSAGDLLREVMNTCANCDVCRLLMDESCLFFPELYRLVDREEEEGIPTTEKELLQMAQLCTLCGLCACPDIRIKIYTAKAARVRENGMSFGISLLADVERVGRWCSRFPGLANAAMKLPCASTAAKRAARIARERHLPRLPPEDFFSWARRKGLNRLPAREPKAAYFAGCTAGYLFPEVAEATVAVLEHNGIAVHVSARQCCGMPTLVEGDKSLTLRRTAKNLEVLLDAAEAGCDPVCSCPTCGFFMKVLLREGAYYSEAYQKSVHAKDNEILVPKTVAGAKQHFSLQKSVYGKILHDNPYFSTIDPLARMNLSEKIRDMGEYLYNLYEQGRLNTDMKPVNGQVAYFAPCHQREQGIGSPYEHLLGMIPDLHIRRVGGDLDCCGMGGSLGFKQDFHKASVRLAEPLIKKIKDASPEALITDCLSCRLQFRQLLPALPVLHPLEILLKAYTGLKVRG